MRHNKHTGKSINELAHLRQSIDCILSTPLGSRVMYPTFGSRLYNLIDQSVTDGWIIDAIDATAEAIEMNEPRVDVQRVDVRLGVTGQIILDLSLTHITTGSNMTINDLKVAA